MHHRLGCQAQHNIVIALTARGRAASSGPLKLKALWHSRVLSAQGMLCTLGTHAVLFCGRWPHRRRSAGESLSLPFAPRLSRWRKRSSISETMPRSITACAAISGIFICGAATHDCKRATQRQAGTQAHRRARRQADPVDRKHRCGDCLAARFRRMLDRPAEPVRALQWARMAVCLNSPHLTSLQLAPQCAGGKHSEPPEVLTAAHTAQRTEAGSTRATSSPGLGSPLPYLHWDWDWAWAGTA